MSKPISVPRLWLQVAMLFVGFVLVGSCGLAVLLLNSYRNRSSAEFAELARANASFIRSIHLPANERFASYLSSVLSMEVRFVPANVPLPTVDVTQEMVSEPVGDGVDLVLIRDKPTLASLLLRRQSLLALGAFWLLSIGLAWAVARRIVMPYIRTQQQLQAAERLAMLGKMTASLAHEIHNPVSAIKLHSQLMQTAEPSSLPARCSESVPILISEAERIESLVNQWMFLTRPHPPRTSTLNLAATIDRVLRSASPMARHAQVDLEVSVPDMLTVQADDRRLRQVFGNLVTNAIQAMPGGGQLTITAEETDQDVVITVTDTGQGFSDEALRRCPELFFSEKEGGMGIGLAVVHEIIQAHQGTMTITNCQPGPGAAIRITLPLPDSCNSCYKDPAADPGMRRGQGD